MCVSSRSSRPGSSYFVQACCDLHLIQAAPVADVSAPLSLYIGLTACTTAGLRCQPIIHWQDTTTGKKELRMFRAIYIVGIMMSGLTQAESLALAPGTKKWYLGPRFPPWKCLVKSCLYPYTYGNCSLCRNCGTQAHNSELARMIEEDRIIRNDPNRDPRLNRNRLSPRRGTIDGPDRDKGLPPPPIRPPRIPPPQAPPHPPSA